MNIVEQLFPNAWKLKVEDEVTTAIIIDMELDPFECSFYNDDCVEINTEEFTHITLSKDDLYRLIDLIEEAEELN